MLRKGLHKGNQKFAVFYVASPALDMQKLHDKRVFLYAFLLLSDTNPFIFDVDAVLVAHDAYILCQTHGLVAEHRVKCCY